MQNLVEEEKTAQIIAKIKEQDIKEADFILLLPFIEITQEKIDEFLTRKVKILYKQLEKRRKDIENGGKLTDRERNGYILKSENDDENIIMFYGIKLGNIDKIQKIIYKHLEFKKEPTGIGFPD